MAANPHGYAVNLPVTETVSSLRPVCHELAGRMDARGGQPPCSRAGRLQRIGGAS